jgi:hypothetical protein
MPLQRISPPTNTKYTRLLVHGDMAYACENKRHTRTDNAVLATYLIVLFQDDMVAHSWYQCVACNIADEKLIAAGKTLTV